MSDELKEHQRKLKQEKEKLNRSYRTLFITKKPSYTALYAARKRIVQDLEEVLMSTSYIANKEGYPESVVNRGLINEGGRKLAADLLDRISSNPEGDLGKQKIKVTKA